MKFLTFSKSSKSLLDIQREGKQKKKKKKKKKKRERERERRMVS
jgi:hypothetical protein